MLRRLKTTKTKQDTNHRQLANLCRMFFLDLLIMNSFCFHRDSCFSGCLVQVQAGPLWFMCCQDENKAYQMQLQFLEHVPLMKRLPKDSACRSEGDEWGGH